MERPHGRKPAIEEKPVLPVGVEHVKFTEVNPIQEQWNEHETRQSIAVEPRSRWEQVDVLILRVPRSGRQTEHGDVVAAVGEPRRDLPDVGLDLGRDVEVNRRVGRARERLVDAPDVLDRAVEELSIPAGDVYDDFVDAFVDEMDAWTVGDPTDDDPTDDAGAWREPERIVRDGTLVNP